jgi:uncharacterized repeat protein (TIGR02543 family)
LNDGTEKTHAATTAPPPADTVADFPADPSRSDYDFTGWNTQPGGGGSVFDSSTTVDGDITVYAQWTDNAGADITLNLDTGDGAFSETIFTIYKSGGTGSRTVSVTGSGYTSPRWYVDEDLKGTGANITINAADYGAGGHILTLVAAKDGLSWSKELPFTVEAGDLRTVIFRPNDGTGAIYAARTSAAGSVISVFPADPGRSGYDFAGWNTQADGYGSLFTASTPVNADTTVYAQWNPKTYTVIFKRNYDADTTLYTETVTVPNTVISPFPADPDRTGYNFAGWNTQANGSGLAFGQSSAVQGNMTVYAQWAHEQFTIGINLDAGTGAFSETSFTVHKGGGTGSRTISLTGSGYTGPRWYVDGDLKASGPGSITINAADYGIGGHILTLFVSRSGVSWSKELPFTVEAGTLRTVIFRPNDDTGTIYAARTSAAGSVISGFPADPGRDGYDFAGWNTQAGGGGEPFTSSTAVPASPDTTTVYAQWTGKTYTVTFKSNDGADTTLYTETVIVPNTVISPFPVDPTRTGYNFAGWNTQANGSGTAFGQSSAVQGNMTVYAQWAHEQFTIGINLDAGTGAFNQSSFTIYKSGGTGTQTVAVTGSGYTNLRWYVDENIRGTGTSITINAADYGEGGHILTLFVSRSGVTWSKELSFTVNN